MLTVWHTFPRNQTDCNINIVLSLPMPINFTKGCTMYIPYYTQNTRKAFFAVYIDLQVDYGLTDICVRVQITLSQLSLFNHIGIITTLFQCISILHQKGASFLKSQRQFFQSFIASWKHSIAQHVLVWGYGNYLVYRYLREIADEVTPLSINFCEDIKQERFHIKV